MKNKQFNSTLWYSLTLIWALFILFATIANTQTLVDLSLKSLFAYDKPIHLVLFGVQTLLLIKAFLSSNFKPYHTIVIIACAIVALFGLLTELMQGWLTSSRTFDYVDVIADIIGCIIVGYYMLNKRRKVSKEN